MAYVAVSGGEEAITASLALLKQRLSGADSTIEVKTIAAALPELIDQVMSESSLYDTTLAALALKQGGGSAEEAVFLLRAFRSTLERPYTSRVIDTSTMRVSRRISAAFKDIPGGQILGITRDYSHRLLDFSLADSKPFAADLTVDENVQRLADTDGYLNLPKVAAYLKEQGLLTPPVYDDTPPRDITMEPLSFPAPRSIRLQALTRGMTQAVMALGYAAIRGFGPAHPTVGELRYGTLDILIDHPSRPGGEREAYYVGCIAVTETESLFSVESPQTPGDTNSAGGADLVNGAEKEDSTSGLGNTTSTDALCNQGDHSLEFGIGYGLVYGQLESKSIAMSVLDFCLSLEDATYPTQDEEFVLYHIDGVEATGFISHLKLPHYVTFQSKLNSARNTQSTAPEGDDNAATL